MDLSECRKIIEKKHPGSEVEWADHGQINYVAIVDKKFVYKFPRTEAYKKILAFEADNYELFRNIKSVIIPRTINLAQDLSYGTFTYVNGIFLNVREMLDFTDTEQLALAIKLSEFIHEINEQAYKSKFKTIKENHADAFPFGNDEIKGWLKEVADFAEVNPNGHTNRYLDLYNELNIRFSSASKSKDLLTHNDLHNENMLFDNKKNLIGIIDFGDMRFESLSAELRAIYRFGETVVNKLLELLLEFNDNDDVAGIKLFAITYEYGIFVEEKYMNEPVRATRLAIAVDLLKNWGEL